MARVLNGFMNDASGKLGSVVLSRSKALSIAKKYQPKVFNPKTANQQKNRLKFKELSTFASLLNNTFIPILYGLQGISKNTFNKFIKDNQNLFDQNGNLIFNNLKCGNPPGVQPWLASFRYNAFLDNSTVNFVPVKNGVECDFSNMLVSVLGLRVINNYELGILDIRHVLTDAPDFSWTCTTTSYGTTSEGYSYSEHWSFDNFYSGGIFFTVFSDVERY